MRAAENEPVLELDAVTVRYPRSREQARPAVDGVSLSVAPGSVLGLVGESGSGKSTIARAVIGLAPVTGGRVLVGGSDATNARGARRRALHRTVQMVFQDPSASLSPRMTVGEILAEAAAVAAGGRPARGALAAEVDRLLALVNLDRAHAGALPRELSGGERQRVALARALAIRPRLLIAAEITSALDVSVQGAVLNMLRELQRELGFAVLFISHDLAVVRYVSDGIVVLRAGSVREAGATDAVLARSQDEYTRRLVAAVPRLTPGPGHTVGDAPAPESPRLKDAGD